MHAWDRVCVLRDGLLQQVDRPKNLFDNPVNLFVAAFIGSPAMNLVAAKLSSDNGQPAVTFGGRQLTLPATVVNSRPGAEQVRRAGGHPRHPPLRLRGRPAGQRLRARMPVTVNVAEELGSDIQGLHHRPGWTWARTSATRAPGHAAVAAALADRDHHTDPGEFTRLGLLTVPAGLVLATVALWVVLRI